MNRVLVTGANGFIGSRLCKTLISNGYHLNAVVRKKCSNKNLSYTKQFLIENIGGDIEWVEILKNVDIVIHLAGRVHVKEMNDKASISKYRSINVEGTMNLARQAASVNVKRFIYMSSVKVCGEISKEGKPFKENDPPAPLGPYAVSKLETEQALKSLVTGSGMELVVIRPPLVYGPGVKANFLKMMKLVDMGIPLPFGNVPNKRSFIALDNLVGFIIRCIEHPAAANQTFLISDGEDLSTSVLLKRLGEAMGKSSKLFPFPKILLELCALLIGGKALVQRLCCSLQVDNRKAIEKLGWSPVVNVEEALEMTVKKYYEEK